MATWDKITTGLDFGSYAAWETALAAVDGDHGRDHVPVFLRLEPPAGMTLVQAIDATRALPELRISRHERDLLATERALAVAGGTQEVRAVVYWPKAALASVPSFWKILQVGPALAVPTGSEPGPGDNLCALVGDLDSTVPIAAVIDDGIGYLNARFRKDRTRTRFLGVWVQGPDRGQTSGEVLCGTVLDRTEIDDLLSSGQDEAAIYRTVNRGIHAITDSATTDRRVAHGTHVLDLAAGAAPWTDDPLGQVPVLAVQLPPAAVRETSGRRLETYLVQGLRWILAETLRQARGTDVPPVVINISLGSLAGSGDRHAFIANWLDFELARHTRMTHGAVRLVVAYGNARLSRLVARCTLRSQPKELVWRVQPDDHTSSYLELRADHTQAAGLRLKLIPPLASGLPELDVPWPKPGEGWQLAGPIAAVTSSVEAGGQLLVHLALSPTVVSGALTPAPAGVWRLQLCATDGAPVSVSARVQRDDTPPGYRALGRQSWLDHPNGWDWDTEQRGYIAPRPNEDAPGCPITRAGTAVAYAGASDQRILFVGAGRPVVGQPDRMRATVYSSEGVRPSTYPDESRGPTLMALGDAGTMLPGMRAAGNLSGSVARLNGTSVAAPQVTRALIRYFLQTPASDRTPEGERRYLTGKEQWTDIDPREGYGALTATVG